MWSKCPSLSSLRDLARESFDQYYHDYNKELELWSLSTNIFKIQEDFKNKLSSFVWCNWCNIEDRDFLKNNNFSIYKDRKSWLHDVSFRYTINKWDNILINTTWNVVPFVKWFVDIILDTFDEKIVKSDILYPKKWRDDLNVTLTHLLDNSVKRHLWIADIYKPIDDKNFSRKLLEKTFTPMCEFLDRRIFISAEYQSFNQINVWIVDQWPWFDFEKVFSDYSKDPSKNIRGLNIVKSISWNSLYYTKPWNLATYNINL